MNKPRNKLLKYIKEMVYRSKETTEYQQMNEPEKILQAIDYIVGKFCPPVCHYCGQDRIEHRLKSEGGGLICRFCGQTFYMMLDGNREWKLIAY